MWTFNHLNLKRRFFSATEMYRQALEDLEFEISGVSVMTSSQLVRININGVLSIL